MEIYFLNKYIDAFYADKKLIGNYSRFPFFKKHNFSNYSFNDQFSLINTFVFSRDLNQKISSYPENLTRINYRLNNPYASFNNLKYLENFIGTKSFKLSINELLETIVGSNYKEYLIQIVIIEFRKIELNGNFHFTDRNSVGLNF